MVTKSKAHLFFLLCRWALKAEPKMKAPLHPFLFTAVSFPSVMLPQMIRKKDSRTSLHKQISEPALGNKAKSLLNLFFLVDLFDKDPFCTSFLESQNPSHLQRFLFEAQEEIEESLCMLYPMQCFLVPEFCLSIYLLTLRSRRLRIKAWNCTKSHQVGVDLHWSWKAHPCHVCLTW